ncbi:hypothetical protein BV898_14187 [Hypsibius exemplaris]|uniref:Uncharacterized protein n=1 Tax=Hypsibius exemplaris TaxID=2072580 RepID=A0A1W0W8K0_HYPEX|nr:hypothetical protein BV898_14187 [Hypsibius exemplaris]
MLTGTQVIGMTRLVGTEEEEEQPVLWYMCWRSCFPSIKQSRSQKPTDLESMRKNAASSIGTDQNPSRHIPVPMDTVGRSKACGVKVPLGISTASADDCSVPEASLNVALAHADEFVTDQSGISVVPEVTVADASTDFFKDVAVFEKHDIECSPTPARSQLTREVKDENEWQDHSVLEHATPDVTLIAFDLSTPAKVSWLDQSMLEKDTLDRTMFGNQCMTPSKEDSMIENADGNISYSGDGMGTCCLECEPRQGGNCGAETPVQKKTKTCGCMPDGRCQDAFRAKRQLMRTAARCH